MAIGAVAPFVQFAVAVVIESVAGFRDGKYFPGARTPVSVLATLLALLARTDACGVGWTAVAGLGFGSGAFATHASAAPAAAIGAVAPAAIGSPRGGRRGRGAAASSLASR